VVGLRGRNHHGEQLGHQRQRPILGTETWEGGIPSVGGPGVGGVPFLSPAASVLLENGTICFSVGPTFTFG
jgi:hypothetical protein